MAKRLFSYAYSCFVPDPNSDVIGLIAYSFYKRDKAAEIRRLVEQGRGEPTDEELLDWSKHNSTELRVKEYKDLARILLERLIKTEVDKIYEPKLRNEIEKEIIGIIRDDLKKLTGSSGFWGGVATSCGGAAVWVVVGAAIVYTSTGLLSLSGKNSAPELQPPQAELQQKKTK